ncbi:MAG: glycosyltransferase [Lacunisphaera sp.]
MPDPVSPPPLLTVIIPTHNPHPERLRRTLAGLREQTLPPDQWECIVVDNASTPPVDSATLTSAGPATLRLVRESQPGLTHARKAGLRSARGALMVFADDDNVLAPDYLAQSLRLAAAHPRLGAYGGRSVPEFEGPPESWTHEFFDLLALRDLGPHPVQAAAESPLRGYPRCAPIGAGMVLRREAADVWLAAPDRGLTDRRGSELTSGGDNDIVLTLFAAGWGVGYFPELQLTHLIPAGRLDAGYLARLNRGIQKSWVQVLARHGICPWPPIATWTVPLRQFKAWFTCRAWRGAVGQIRWQGACGHFEGRAIIAP